MTPERRTARKRAQVISAMRHAFWPLPLQAKAAITVLFGWMLLLTMGLTVALIITFSEANRRSAEQRATAATARAACERSKVFGPPFIDHLERVEAIQHTGTLESSVTFEGKKVKVLDFYRSTIPKKC